MISLKDFYIGTLKGSACIGLIAIVIALANHTEIMFLAVVLAFVLGYYVIIGIPVTYCWYYAFAKMGNINNPALSSLFSSGLSVTIVLSIVIHFGERIFSPSSFYAPYGASPAITIPIIIFPVFLLSIWFIRKKT